MILPYFLSNLGMGAGGSITPTGPATIREAVRARLASVVATTEVGGRVFYSSRPQSSILPAATYLVAGRTYGRHLRGPNGVSSADVRISIWSSSIAQAEALADAVHASFDGFTGSIGSLDVLGVFGGDAVDLPEPPQDGSDKTIYQIVLPMTVVHRVPIPAYS